MPSEKKKKKEKPEVPMDPTEDTRVISSLGEVTELQELKDAVYKKGERVRKKAKELCKKHNRNGRKEKVR